MARWAWALLIGGCIGVASGSPVDAKDRSLAKSLTRTGSTAQGSSARTCTGDDVLGSWNLLTFESSYRFRNPQAPYLFPHQVFQYSNRGGAKSAHSRMPILDSPDRVFETVPLDLTFRAERGGRIVIKTKGRGETVEIWSCLVVTQDRAVTGGGSDMQRGDLIMTLLGGDGQALFVRHLRKNAA